MNPMDLLAKAGLWCREDEVGLWQWRVSGEVQPRIRRFNAFIQELLASPEDKGALAARLVGLDGIRPRSLSEIERQYAVPYQKGDDVVLEWEEQLPPRTERRVLASLTATLWPTDSSAAGSDSENCMPQTALVQGLQEYLFHSPLYRALDDRVLELERDALCWWYQCLPAPLFAHQSGLQVLSALPRSALARLCRKLAVNYPAPEGQRDDEADTDCGLTADLIDAADSSEGGDKSPVVLQLGIDLLTISRQEVDGITKRRWAQSLFDLRARAQTAGPITSLLLAWGLDLCEHGTVGQTNLARTTVQQYFKRAARPLFETLRLMSQNFDDAQWQAQAMRERYLGLMQAQSVGNKKTMASALTSFHSFLVEWLDIEPLETGLHEEVPVARVQAQVIWPHELDVVMNWLEQVEDVRVRNAVMIMLLVASECPARTNELLRLRIVNVHTGLDHRGACMEIEIARRAANGRLKTPAAQRRLVIHNETTIDLIERWVRRRADEGAPRTAMLFGDPNDDSRIHRGAVVASLLNRLLKAATGEPDVRIHTLRHSCVSQRIGADLSSASVMDPNRHAVTAAETGHASAVSSFQSYFHRYEWNLRTGLDAALLELITVTSSQAGSHLKLKPATLRQHAHRRAMNLEEYTWWQLRQVPVTKSFADVAEPFQWQTPVMPKLPARVNSTLTVALALSWLEELSARTREEVAGPEVLGLRFGVAEESLAKMLPELMSVCHYLGRVSWPRTLSAKSSPPADLGHALTMAKFDLARAYQRKFHKLEDFLSQEQALPVLREAWTSWQTCRRRGYIALDQSGEVLGLYRLLMEAKVDPRDLRICAQTSIRDRGQMSAQEVAEDADRAMHKSQAVDDFLTVFGVRPRESSQSARADRPSTYLQWDDPRHREAPSSASSSCAGLDAWMIASKALLSMRAVQS